MANLTLDLAENLQTIGTKSAYGQPVEMTGSTVVPVSLTSYGFGGGEADGADTENQGSGGGGGGMSIPVGAYITRDGVTRFEPNTIALLAVATPFMFVTGRAVARVIKALKR